MGNYDDYYDKVFGNINVGDDIKIYRDGETFEGTLLFKNPYYITVQLPFYREGFSMPDFYTGHSKLAGAEGVEFEIEEEELEDADDFDEEELGEDIAESTEEIDE